MQEKFISRQIEIDGQWVECRFSQPQRNGNDYRCQYTIDFPNKPKRSHAFGVDAVQALLLAMKKAHVDLLTACRHNGWHVTWLEDENLGLPLDQELRDLSPDNRF